MFKPICPSQHGFSCRRSTITNLLITEKLLAEALNVKAEIDIISVNFARAFHKLSTTQQTIASISQQGST
jgi:hypothetical protein